jgi:hypothetical protein
MPTGDFYEHHVPVKLDFISGILDVWGEVL